MKVYLAGERNAVESQGKAAAWIKNVQRRLFTYYYHGFLDGNTLSRDARECAEMGLDLFLDSGAFTAFTQKTTITVERYAEFLHRTKAVWTVCSSLDAIGDPEKSYEYFTELRKLGCKVQPVFHAREDTKWLVKYLDEGHDYIFIGGMVPETTKWLVGWLDDLWTRFLTKRDGTPRVKLHGFGLTDQLLMFRYPWFSVDSTSWLMTGVFGACAFITPRGLRKVVFSSNSPKVKDMESWHYQRLTPVQRIQVDAWLAEAGVTAEQCASHFSYRDVVNARTFQLMEQFAAKTFVGSQLSLT